LSGVFPLVGLIWDKGFAPDTHQNLETGICARGQIIITTDDTYTVLDPDADVE